MKSIIFFVLSILSLFCVRYAMHICSVNAIWVAYVALLFMCAAVVFFLAAFEAMPTSDKIEKRIADKMTED